MFGACIHTWDKTKPGSETLIVTRQKFMDTGALQSYQLSKIYASKNPIDLKEPVSTKSAKVDVLKNRGKFSIMAHVFHSLFL